MKLFQIQQKFNSDSIKDIQKETSRQLQSEFCAIIQRGSRIGVAVGSRGISNLKEIVKSTVDFIKAQGAEPFIFPAMGSHGGATAEGQLEVLDSYGVNEENMKVPVIATMDVHEISDNKPDLKLFMNRSAWESDGIILINRVKSHTDFHDRYESGLVKMAVIGVGSHAMATEIHKYGIYGLKEIIPDAAKKIFDTGKILGGVAIVENAYDKPLQIAAVKCADLLTIEPDLLDLAKKNMPGLPCNDIDILIIQEMGKNISGVGMDPNIIGRIKIEDQPEPQTPNIRRIIVTDLTDESHGNAIGTGLADVITRRLFDKIDFEVTRENIYTSTFLERGKIPLMGENDRQAFDIAFRSCGPVEVGKERVMVIKNTLNLSQLYISEAIYSDIKDNPNIVASGAQVELFNNTNLNVTFHD